MQARYLAKLIRQIFIGFILLLLGTGVAQATILFQHNAENMACDTVVPQSVWSTTGNGGGTAIVEASRMWARCDTPVPNSGRSKYFRITTLDGMGGAWNVRDVNQINLTPGVTYYFGGFFRFDRIIGNDIWHDSGSNPDSFDKLFDVRGNVRWLIDVGWANSVFLNTGASNTWDHQFTFNVSLPGASGTCTSCGPDTLSHNFAPYSATNPFRCSYGKWYAVVMAVTPSSGGSSTNGRLEMFINGVKVSSHNVKTQDSSTPYVNRFEHSGTIAQPAYDALAHVRKFDNFIFADNLADIQNAGLMSDPEAGAPNPPTNLRVQ